MILVTASIALPEPTSGIASGMTDIHVYSSSGKQGPFTGLFTALLPPIFELGMFKPATSRAERFGTHFKLTGPELQSAWAEVGKLMNEWILGNIFGRDPDEAQIDRIAQDVDYINGVIDLFCRF